MRYLLNGIFKIINNEPETLYVNRVEEWIDLKCPDINPLKAFAESSLHRL